MTQELVRRTDAASMIQAWWKRLMLARRLEKIARVTNLSFMGIDLLERRNMFALQEIALEIWLKQIVIEIERQERDRKVQAANVIVLWWKRCLQKRRLDELERRRQVCLCFAWRMVVRTTFIALCASAVSNHAHPRIIFHCCV